MNEKFAINPSAIDDIKDIKYVFSKFGFHEGRFISSIPKNWKALLYARIEEYFPDGLSKSTAKELVRKMEQRGGLISLGLEFDPSKSWVGNASRFEDIFQGIIISSQERNLISNLKYKTLEEIDDDFFSFSRDTKIKATVEGFCDVARVLIEQSASVCIVDPYFKFDSPSNLKVLTAFIQMGIKRKCEEFIIYTSSKFINNNFQLQLDKYWQQFKKDSLRIKFFSVNKESSGKVFHPRYLFSLLGAINFDKGFAISISGDAEEYDVSTIDLNRHETLIQEYMEFKHGLVIDAEYIASKANSN